MECDVICVTWVNTGNREDEGRETGANEDGFVGLREGLEPGAFGDWLVLVVVWSLVTRC